MNGMIVGWLFFVLIPIVLILMYIVGMYGSTSTSTNLTVENDYKPRQNNHYIRRRRLSGM